MIDVSEIEKTILDLETNRDTTYATCEKLASLYIVRDALKSRGFRADEGKEPESRTEFSEIAKRIDKGVLIDCLSEHFELIKALYNKEYQSIISKLKSVE